MARPIGRKFLIAAGFVLAAAFVFWIGTHLPGGVGDAFRRAAEPLRTPWIPIVLLSAFSGLFLFLLVRFLRREFRALGRRERITMGIGFGLILVAAALITLIWAGTYLPGLAGEFFSMLAGFMWTPILLDLSIFFFGVILVLGLNTWIRVREGDEYVYLEQVDGPEVPGDMPSEARAAVFREEPEPAGMAPALAAIEGALDLHDDRQATELLFKLPPDQLDEPEVLAMRIRLARSQGRSDQAAELLEALRLKSPHHSLCPPEE